MHLPKKSKGFTLVELLVVISIIAILSVIGITIFTSVQSTARDGKRRADLDAIKLALEQYKSVNGEYPFPRNPPQLAGNPWYCSNETSAGRPDENFADNTQIINALSPYLQNGIPKDPSITNNYQLDILSLGTYFLYAELEIDPAQKGIINGDGCVGIGAQVDLLITGQQ